MGRSIEIDLRCDEEFESNRFKFTIKGRGQSGTDGLKGLT